MKKFLLSSAVVLASLFYFLYQNVLHTSATMALESPAPEGSTPSPATQGSGSYADGIYTGSTEDAYYGPVEVRASVQNGALASVDFLQYPNDRETSLFISQQAMPILKQEAIKAQSAKVDIVSGATDTSIAFQESLGTALAQAKL